MKSIIKRLINIVRGLKYLSENNLWLQREKDIVYLTEKIISDNHYLAKNYFTNDIKILNKIDSFQLIKNKMCSFVRTGDGEINLMEGEDQPFQKYDQELASKLIDILKYPQKNLIVGINKSYFEIPNFNITYSKSFALRNYFDFRKFYLNTCNSNAIYLDSRFTFSDFGDFSEISNKFWDDWVEIFRDLNLVIVCGTGILDKYQYDVFKLAKTKEYIPCPKINAWNDHQQIVEEIKKVDKNKIIVFILGMAGKAIIPEITNLGFIGWDIGHLAKGYNSFMLQMEPTTENIKKFYAPD